MDGRCMTQTELAERWQISEATLERWRTEADGQVFLKLGAQVRYRVRDVEAFEAEVLRDSTRSDGCVVQHEIVDQTKHQLKTTIRPALPSPSGCIPVLAEPICVQASLAVPGDDDCTIKPNPMLEPRLPAPDTPNRQSHRSVCSH